MKQDITCRTLPALILIYLGPLALIKRGRNADPYGNVRQGQYDPSYKGKAEVKNHYLEDEREKQWKLTFSISKGCNRLIQGRGLFVPDMQNEIIDVKSGRLFPFPFLVLGVIFFLTGLAVIVNNPILSIILMGAGAFIVSAYEGTEIDPSSNTYREYQSFCFIKNGRKKKYGSIEKIFINSGKVAQKVYTAHTMNSSTFSNVEYNAYLKFGEGVKIFLLSNSNKGKLLNRLKPVADSLKAPLIDNTVAQ